MSDFPTPRSTTLPRSYSHLTVAAVLVLLGAAAGAWWVHSRFQAEITQARHKFQESSREHSRDQAESIATVFRSIYEGIRTIARLPGVRGIDRYAHNFDANARGTTQEIYNNLASNVAMSEVYIVPLEMQPDEPDPVTGKLQEPITTFDELIVGRNASSPAEGKDPSGLQGEHDAVDEEGQEHEAEEIEIYEYRLMRAQLDWLAARYPTEDHIKGLKYPAVCGAEVITCDNRAFDPRHPDDRARSGLVYSTPFYDAQGKLKGCISAVILTDALRALLTSGDFALRNAVNDYTVMSRSFGAASVCAQDVRAVTPATDLLYSEVVPVAIADGMGAWSLWCGRADSDFASSPEVRAAEASAFGAYLGIGGIVFTLLLTIHSAQRTLSGTRRHSEELASEVASRTSALRDALAAADQASRAKSDFLANMSHEIRTPMTAIMGYADLLLDPDLSPAERADHIQTMRRQSEHLLMIVNDILDISKIEAGAMTVECIPADPVQIVEDVLSLMRVRAAQGNLALLSDYQWPLPSLVRTDPHRLRQILVNLVGNAVKFTAKGSVTVRMGFDPATCALRVEVADTGIGISPENLAALFKPFSQADGTMTRRYGGTGLGLSISKRLAALLGGDIKVSSEPGRGSTFALEISCGPVDLTQMRTLPSAANAEFFAASEPHRVHRSLRVLLAEDSKDNQRLISFHLKRADHSVELADNGKIAVDLALAAIASGTPFDIVLMDMQMPEMDGYSAASLLRVRGYTGPIIALTAHAMAGDRERCIQAGCDDHLVKPISPLRLLEACAKWGAARSREQSPQHRSSAA